MKKFIVLTLAIAFVFGMAMVTTPSTAQAVSQPVVTTGAAQKFVFYGYIKFRANYEDKYASDFGKRGSKTFGGFYDPRGIPKDNTTAGENDRINFNARQTRFGFKIYGDSFDGWKTAGRMEFDMYGSAGHNHSSESPRMRIGEIYLTKGNTKITIGKGWGMFGTRHPPFVENFISIVGDGFRRGDRVDIAQKFPCGEDTYGVELMVMTYNDDDDIAFDKDGKEYHYHFNTEKLGFPYTSVELSMVSKRLGYAGGKPLGLWLQGIYGNMSEPDDIYDDVSVPGHYVADENGNPEWVPTHKSTGQKVRSGKDYDVYGVELDWYVPIISSMDRARKAGNLAVSGKAWWGQALWNAAGLGNGYDVVPKSWSSYTDENGVRHDYVDDWDEVESYGGWVGLSYWITNNLWVDVYGAYEGIDTSSYYPGEDHSPTRQWGPDGYYDPNAMIEDNYEVTGNIFWRPARSILFGLEYAYVDNEYNTDYDAHGNDNAELNSISFVAYYFF